MWGNDRVNIKFKYQHFYDWNIQRREDNTKVFQWLNEFVEWRKDYHTLVGNHPGYLIKLTLPHYYDWTPDCWVTAWCQANTLPHKDGTPAFALVIHNDGLVVSAYSTNITTADYRVIRILFDRAADAALFKLSFMDKISSKIATRENSCNML